MTAQWGKIDVLKHMGRNKWRGGNGSVITSRIVEPLPVVERNRAVPLWAAKATVGRERNRRNKVRL
jgi:hypothetical protein